MIDKHVESFQGFVRRGKYGKALTLMYGMRRRKPMETAKSLGFFK
jgi:hypothetical protein